MSVFSENRGSTCVCCSRRLRCTASTSARRTNDRTATARCSTPARSTRCRPNASSRPRSSDGTRKDFRSTRREEPTSRRLRRRRRSYRQLRSSSPRTAPLSHQVAHTNIRWLFTYMLLWCHAVASLTTLATMRCQSTLSSKALLSCVGLTVLSQCTQTISRYSSLWRPSPCSSLLYSSSHYQIFNTVLFQNVPQKRAVV